jgi:hypothetical protein
MSIESRNFIATDADIAKIAAQAIDGETRSTEARGLFFKALIATTQHELGSPPRVRNVKTDKLTAEDVTAHLLTFEGIAKRFCEKAREVAANTVPSDVETLRSRTRKFYSAASTVRGFIRSGGDIRGIAAHKATKGSLATPRTKRKPNADALKRRATAIGAELEKIARSLNGDFAREVLTPLLVKLGAIAGKGTKTTRDPAEAMSEHRALSTKAGTFFPIQGSAVQ